MPLTFYPQEGDLTTSSIRERLESLMAAAEEYKAVVLDTSAAKTATPGKRGTPGDLRFTFNWEEIAKLLKEIRDLPEATTENKKTKAEALNKLAEIYEVLRAAKMSKLEAVRLALITEAKQLSSGSARVA